MKNKYVIIASILILMNPESQQVQEENPRKPPALD